MVVKTNKDRNYLIDGDIRSKSKYTIYVFCAPLCPHKCLLWTLSAWDREKEGTQMS